MLSFFEAGMHRYFNNLEPGREPTPETNPAGTSILDFQPPGHKKINFCCLSNPEYGILSWQLKQMVNSTNAQSHNSLKVDTIFFLFVVLVYNVVLAHSKCLINPC